MSRISINPGESNIWAAVTPNKRINKRTDETSPDTSIVALSNRHSSSISSGTRRLSRSENRLDTNSKGSRQLALIKRRPAKSADDTRQLARRSSFDSTSYRRVDVKPRTIPQNTDARSKVYLENDQDYLEDFDFHTIDYLI